MVHADGGVLFLSLRSKAIRVRVALATSASARKEIEVSLSCRGCWTTAPSR